MLRSEALISYASIVAVRSAALTGGDYVPKTGFVSEVFSSVGIFWTSLSASIAPSSSFLFSFSTTLIEGSAGLASSSAFSAFGSGKPSRFHLPWIPYSRSRFEREFLISISSPKSGTV